MSTIYFCLGVIVGCLELTVVSYTSTYLIAVNAQLVPSPNKHPLQISFVYLPLALKRSLSLLFTAIGYWLTPKFSVTIALLIHHTLEQQPITDAISKVKKERPKRDIRPTLFFCLKLIPRSSLEKRFVRLMENIGLTN